MRFTKPAIDALCLPQGKTDHIEWDDELPGFGIRLRRGATIRRTWIAQWRINGQQRRERIGDVRQIELEAARKAAKQRFAKLALGIDPAAEKAAAQAKAEAAALTLGIAADRYLDAKKDTLRPSTYRQAALYFKMHWQPLRKRALASITRADIAARLQALVKENGRVAAARARSNLAALFSWAAREGLVESNPVIATNNPAEGIKARERILADEEIRSIWTAAGEAGEYGRVVRLLLLTGCRREEIGGLAWSEIDLDTGLLTIPGTRTKNHRELQLTLPALALDILQSCPQEGSNVFGKRGFMGWSFNKLHLDSRIAQANGAPLAPWRLHDLRRTFRTGLGKVGVQPHIAELCINHVKGGVEAIYDKHKYQPEIKTALALWADHVLGVIEGRDPKVVALKRA